VENLKAKTKFKILIIGLLVQVWFWPMWFAYVVQSSPVAVSSFFTAVGLLIWNIGSITVMYDKVDWEESLDRARKKSRL